MENKNPIWSRLWFLWAILTALYLLLYLGLDSYSRPIEKAVQILGLFVPFGLWNGSAFLISLSRGISHRSLLIVPAGIFSLFVIFLGNKILNHYFQLHPAVKLILNLAVLLLLTILVDYSIWGTWASLGLVTGSFKVEGLY